MTQDKEKDMPNEKHDKFDEHRNEYDEVNMQNAWAANAKRTYDEYQDLALTAARRAQTMFDKMMSDAQNITFQTAQNAIETANMTGKQALRHAEIAIDRQWNVDEVGWIIKGMVERMPELDVYKDAIKVALTDVLANKE